ncbi:MAG: TM2 domain-containing protein [Chitinophagales bacterium]
MKTLMKQFPDIQTDELGYVEQLVRNFDQEEMELFTERYKKQRYSPKFILFMNLIAFLGIAGIQRFLLGEVKMGLVYAFTWGFLGIGIVYDFINHKRMTLEYNEKIAFEVAQDVKYMRAAV